MHPTCEPFPTELSAGTFHRTCSVPGVWEGVITVRGAEATIVVTEE